MHSEHGALPGEHPGRAANPILKVYDLAWLEFEKPDLERTAWGVSMVRCAFVRGVRSEVPEDGADQRDGRSLGRRSGFARPGS
jgi:hypothetical protein